MQANQPNRLNPVEVYAPLLVATEVTIGSAIHGFKIPLGGHLMSLNQGVILNFATQKCDSRRAAVAVIHQVSLIGAALKSLSPMGNRLGPMLSITMQGGLFSLGVGLFGVNAFGVAIGMVALSVWAFIQPLLTSYILFGADWFRAIERMWTKLAQALHLPLHYGVGILLAIVLLKMLTAAGLGFWCYRRKVNPEFEQNYSARLEHWTLRLRRLGQEKKSNPSMTSEPSRGTKIPGSVLSDLLSPFFLVSLLISVAFFIWNESPSATEIILRVLRIFAMGWLVFLASRKLIPSFKYLRGYADRYLRGSTVSKR